MKRDLRAFSLFELLNLLSLVAVLAALGMYGTAKYVRHAKTAEAAASCETMARAAAAYYEASDFTQPAGSKLEALRAMRHFPPPSNGSVPSDLQNVTGKRYKSAPADWAASPWRELHFSMPQPQFYAYSFEAEGAGPAAKAAAVATGDLDGNGVFGTFRLGVSADAQAVPKVGATLERTNPEE